MKVKEQHPEVETQFQCENFVVHKSERQFPPIAIAPAHENRNAVIKGDGGAIRLTEDAPALRRWMVAGPEMSQFISNYKAASRSKEVKKDTHHHEESPAAQKHFLGASAHRYHR